jgi:probable phosphoglycerate mutase
MGDARYDLFLVRHGTTDWNLEGRLMGRSDVPLNDRGQNQAAGLAAALAGFPIRTVLASPQRRAQETAARIAQALGVEVATEPLLAEVWLGRWQGKRYDELVGDPDLEPFFRDAAYRCDAVEPSEDVRERVTRVVEGLTNSTVLVSHGDPLRLLISHLLGMPLADYRRLQVGTGSVSVVRVGSSRAELLVLNWQTGDLRAAVGR